MNARPLTPAALHRRHRIKAWARRRDVTFTTPEFRRAFGLKVATAHDWLRDAVAAGIIRLVEAGRQGGVPTPTIWCAA